MPNFMSVVALTLCLFNAYAVDIPITSDFDVTEKGRTLHFRRVDLFTLQGDDLAKFQSMTDDYDMQKMAFGKIVADALWYMSFATKNPGYFSYMLKKTEFRNTIPGYYTHEWFIEDMSRGGRFVGTLSLSKPKYYPDGFTQENSVLLGVSLHKDYRGKKFAKTFGPKVLDVVKGFRELWDKSIVILAIPENGALPVLAKYLGLEALGISNIHIDYLMGLSFITPLMGYRVKR